MRIIRNTEFIKRRKRMARWAAFGGFVLLVSTFGLAFYPKFILIAYVLLLVGFVIFNFGMQQMGKWSRNPRNDVVLDERLQPSAESKRAVPFSDKYTLIHYPHIGRRVVEHLLVYPGGVLVLTTRELPGLIHARGSRWRKRGGGLTRFFSFSGPQLGNPSMETQLNIAAIEKVLEEHQLEVDVSGVVVFINQASELDVEQPDYPVLHGDELPLFVRSLADDPSISTKDREELVQLLSGGIEFETAKPTRRPVKVKRRVV